MTLQEIQAAATTRHERARKAARQRGRTAFPDLPYECSWAFGEEFRRNADQTYDVERQAWPKSPTMRP